LHKNKYADGGFKCAYTGRFMGYHSNRGIMIAPGTDGR